MYETSPDIYEYGYTHKSHIRPTHKIQWQQQKHQVWTYRPLKQLSGDHNDRPNQQANILIVLIFACTYFREFHEFWSISQNYIREIFF